MRLRPYQQDAIAAVEQAWATGHQDTLLVMATGGGKTNCLLHVLMSALDADPSARALVLAHRRELIEQPLDRIQHMDAEWLNRGILDRPRVGVMMAERNDADRQLTIATVQTLVSERRLRRLLDHGPITHLVIDECHHATAASYMHIWQQLRAANPNLLHLGVTATPMRADGDGLVKVYSHVAARITIADLVRDGYLVQPRWLGISTGISLKGVHSRNGDFEAGELAQRFDTPAGRAIITKAWQDYAADRRSIAFTASVAGAHDLAQAFRDIGVTAAALDGTTPKEERRRILADYKAGRIQVLANCQVLTEGFDAPGTGCVMMCRPTKSDSLYIQCMGRGLRPAMGIAQPGENCLILDFLPKETRNIVMAGDVLGLPKEVTEAVVKELDEEAEPGEVQMGFTFDGETFDSSGTPLEIIARQLDYLNSSPFAWHRRDGWMTLGLGSDNAYERILVIPPGQPSRLFGLRRAKGEYRASWAYTLLLEGDLGECGEEAQRWASRYGAGVLMSKGTNWRTGLATEGQVKFLHRLAKGDLKLRTIQGLRKGEAAELITHYQAVQALDGVLQGVGI